jgi:HSP20 family protein
MLNVTRIIFPRRRGDLAIDDPELETTTVHTIVAWLGEAAADAEAATYRPPLDVLETASAIEIVADLPGVPPDAVRVAFTGEAVVITGEKRPAGCRHADAFHLAERTFGRFACAVRIDGAVDAAKARAVIRTGELHITLPRIADRRRREMAIAVERA